MRTTTRTNHTSPRPRQAQSIAPSGPLLATAPSNLKLLINGFSPPPPCGTTCAAARGGSPRNRSPAGQPSPSRPTTAHACQAYPTCSGHPEQTIRQPCAAPSPPTRSRDAHATRDDRTRRAIAPTGTGPTCVAARIGPHRAADFHPSTFSSLPGKSFTAIPLMSLRATKLAVGWDAQTNVVATDGRLTEGRPKSHTSIPS